MKGNTKLIVSVLGIAAVVLVSLYIYNQHKHRIYDKLQEQNQVELEEPTKEQEDPVEEEVIIPIDFAALKEVNPEIYAWIDVEGTTIQYPIAQSATNDSYYLEHTIEGVKGYPGSIYTEMVNAKDFSDYNTLIYGHRMSKPVMFNDLGKFEDKVFFDEHDTITIYTEDAIKNYRIYAAVVYDDRHIMHNFDWDDPVERLRFIQSLQESNSMRTHFRDGMTIDENSHLITLSTCINDMKGKRYLVIGEEIIADEN